MKDKTNIILICFGGIVEIISKLPEKMNEPFYIEFCKDSLKTVFIFLCAYALGIGIYLSTRRNYRRGEEYGSAVWGNAKQVNKKYMQKPETQNKLLTQNVSIGLKAQKHRSYFVWHRDWPRQLCGLSDWKGRRIVCAIYLRESWNGQ